MTNMKKCIKTVILLFVFALISTSVFSQSVTGQWRTIDDETNKQKSIVDVYVKVGKLYGKVLKTWDDDGVTPTNKNCEKCKGALKDKPIIGMNIINGLERKGKNWEGKKGILDPGNGKVYNVKIWLEDTNTLTVRGSIGPFGRKQTWHRVKK
jgi:uncharacterized protein (DUF2147 family)